MTKCPICDGTGELHDIDQHIPNETKLKFDPGLRAFMEQTDLRSEEEKMMQCLYPRMFESDTVSMMIEFHPVGKQAPGELKEPPAPSMRAQTIPVRTGGDVLREAAKFNPPPAPDQPNKPHHPADSNRGYIDLKKLNPHAAAARMKEIGKGLGF